MGKKETDGIDGRKTTVLFALLDHADELFAMAKSQDDLDRIFRLVIHEIECRRYARSLDLAGFDSDGQPESEEAEREPALSVART